MPGISDSPPSRPKRLVPTNFSPRYFSSPSASTTRSMIMRRPFEGEVGAVLDVLDALLDPRLLVGIRDVHVFDADLAAVGLAQPVHDLAQGRGIAQPERAEDQDRPVPVGLLEAVGRRDRAPDAAPGAPGRADRGRLPDGRGCDRSGSAGRRARCRRRRRGSLLRSRPASGMAAPLPALTLRLAAARGISVSGTSMTRAPLGAQDAPRTSASTSPRSSASASKKVRQSASTRLGSSRKRA